MIEEERRAKISEALRRRWEDPEYRERRKGEKRSPETRAKLSAAAKRQWADPEVRARMVQSLALPELRARQSKELRQRWKDPEWQTMMSEMTTRLWEDPKHRDRMMSVFQEMWDDEARAKRSTYAKILWDDPEKRARMSAYASSPENVARLARLRDEMLSTPEGQKQARRYLENKRIVKQLREQDGDLCQLCLEPIDFELVWPHPLYVNIDHILPRRGGGTSDMENLWLTHATCNQKKSAWWCGREDGTTDRRQQRTIG